MTSVDVLKAISINLINYFGTNRKESCFDISGANLPLCHYPIRHHRTLINYQQDTSKPVKHYFSSQDLRKRLTCFNSTDLSEERNLAIVNKLKYYIKMINKKIFMKTVSNRYRNPPWNRYWWKSTGKTFRAIYLMSQYGIRDKQLKFVPKAAYFSKFRSKYDSKIKRIHGKPVVLRTCPHPYISRKEADRIVNHAAKLLLYSENFEPLAYQYTATGLKIKHLKPLGSSKNVQKLEIIPTVKKRSSENLYSPFKKEDKDEQKIYKTAPFKIKKRSQEYAEIEDDEELKPESLIDLKKPSEDKDDIRNSESTVKKKDSADYFCCCKPTNVPSTEQDIASEKYKSSKEEPSTNNEFTINEKKEDSKRKESIAEESYLSKDEELSGWLGSQISKLDDASNNQYKYQKSNNKCETPFKKRFNEKQKFEIKIITGVGMGACLKSKISLNIRGTQNNLRKSVVLKKSKNNSIPFQAGQTDIFKISSSRYLGFVKSIQIEYVPGLTGSDWYLESVTVTDCDRLLKYFFNCGKLFSMIPEGELSKINVKCNFQFVNPSMSDAYNSSSDEENNNNAIFVFNNEKNQFENKNKSQSSEVLDAVCEDLNICNSDKKGILFVNGAETTEDNDKTLINIDIVEIIVLENNGY